MLGCTSKKLEVSDSFLGLRKALPEDISAHMEQHAGKRSLERETSEEPRKEPMKEKIDFKCLPGTVHPKPV